MDVVAAVAADVAPTAPAPEGIVCAHGCVYAVDIDEGDTTSLRRLSPAGERLEKVDSEMDGAMWSQTGRAEPWSYSLTRLTANRSA